MNVLLDTNIVIDILSKREGYMNSLRILRCCETKKLEGYISAITVTDIMYILRKHVSPTGLRESMQTLLSVVDVADVLKVDIKRAFSSGAKDFEDAVQAACAQRIKAEYIVTHNLRDFEKSAIPAISPANLLELL